MPCMSVTAHKTATALGKNISATQVLVPAGKQHPTSLSTSELLLQPCQLLIVVSNNTSRTAGSISLQYKNLRQFHIINFPPMLSFHSGLFFFFTPGIHNRTSQLCKNCYKLQQKRITILPTIAYLTHFYRKGLEKNYTNLCTYLYAFQNYSYTSE